MSIECAGGVTPWASLGQRWGHSWHTMCSYLGTFPAPLARAMIAMLSSEGDVIMDPFSGRGTTLLEGRLLGRLPLVSDLNPVAVALSRAKNVSANKDAIFRRVDQLRANYDHLLYLPEAHVQSDDIQLIYHSHTLAQLCYLRRRLVNSIEPSDMLLLGALLGVMHGSERQDGTSAYASISMPNTFSMSPNYVRRYVETNRLNRVSRDVFTLLVEKIDRLFRDPPPTGSEGVVTADDAKQLAHNEQLQKYLGQVKLVVTSPPYLDVVNYAKQNWIRNWLLHGQAGIGKISDLDDNLTLKDWLNFAGNVVEQMKRFLRPDGVLVMVMGDVAKPSRAHISLAREILQRIIHDQVFSYVGCLDDRMGHEIKTTRIWKDTKGRATEIDRIIVMSDSIPEFDTDALYRSLGLSESPDVDAFGIDPTVLARTAQSLAGSELKAAG